MIELNSATEHDAFINKNDKCGTLTPSILLFSTPFKKDQYRYGAKI